MTQNRKRHNRQLADIRRHIAMISNHPRPFPQQLFTSAQERVTGRLRFLKSRQMSTESDDIRATDIRIRKVESNLVDEFSRECGQTGGDARIGKRFGERAREVSPCCRIVSMDATTIDGTYL